MALTIKENHGVYSVVGSLDETTATNFQMYFENILNTSDTLTIDIGNIEEINTNGINAIKTLYVNAKTTDKHLLIIGNVSEHIYNSLQTIKIAA